MLSKPLFTTIDETNSGQRLDNYVIKSLKGVPKSHIYRLVRCGSVRVNKKRCAVHYCLCLGDVVRLPPVRMASPVSLPKPPPTLTLPVLFEDEAFIAINKPAGLAVHGGSGVSFGVIESMRAQRPQAKFLELVHRLDKDTSGVLLLAKKRVALLALQSALQQQRIDKRYLILVRGAWKAGEKRVQLALQKYTLANGERRVRVVTNQLGQASETVFRLVRHIDCAPEGRFSLLEAQLLTGRTHQLRVQLAYLGFPIVGDDKYGDFDFNKRLKSIRRMFLHAESLQLQHPITQEDMVISASLPDDLKNFLEGCATA